MRISLIRALVVVLSSLDATRVPLAKAHREPHSYRGIRHPCVLLFQVTDYAGGVNREELKCELKGEDVRRNGRRIVDLVFSGVTPQDLSLATNQPIISGQTTLFASETEYSDGTLYILSQSISLGTKGAKKGHGRELKQESAVVGDRDILAVLVESPDSKPTLSASDISDSIFGSYGDPVNLVSQYKACSYEQLRFSPSRRVYKGVYSLKIDKKVKGVPPEKISEYVENALEVAFETEDLSTIVDHVILCLPPGTKGEWLAYGLVNHHLTVFNDVQCSYVTTTMHEVAHNLNLGHSGETGDLYGDQSGLMGYTYDEDDIPLLCFNGPKSWQLGWYSDRHAEVDPLHTFWNGRLVGVAEYDKSDGYTVILKVTSGGWYYDYYVSFNRRTGMNAGTQEGGDKVLVTSRLWGNGYAASNLEAKLSEGFTHELFDYVNFMSIYITVNEINTKDETSPGYADVTVSTSYPKPPTFPLGNVHYIEPTSVPTMPVTTGAPTITQMPSPVPNVNPSATPTSAPSKAQCDSSICYVVKELFLYVTVNFPGR